MTERWDKARAAAWMAEQGEIRGCNYLPRTAVNSTEMWQTETFDSETIAEELSWARDAGLNSLRVFLQYVVWRHDASGYKERIDRFLKLADRYGMRTMLVLFDDCAFSGKQPYVGPQPEPVPGVHNSGWTPSPGIELALDPARAHELAPYVKDIIGTFAQDPRVNVWDLYNEPGNSNLGDRTMWLVEAAFRWARQVNPQQPLTVGGWRFPVQGFRSVISQRFFELSDVVSFHYYSSPNDERLYAFLQEYGAERPLLCTEWLHRQSGNTFTAMLPIFRSHKVGWYVWGLVAGRTQTYMHWNSKPGTPIPEIWQHDLFHPDGTPYDPAELALIRG